MKIERNASVWVGVECGDVGGEWLKIFYKDVLWDELRTVKWTLHRRAHGASKVRLIVQVCPHMSL